LSIYKKATVNILQFKKRKMNKWNLCIGIWIFMLLASTMIYAEIPLKPTTQPATKLSGRILATVAGEPIYEVDVLDGLPDDLFESQLSEKKENKLTRLIKTVVHHQFLKQLKIAVYDPEIEKGLADFKRMVMTPGCSCHGGGYKSLEQFMALNGYTLSELRQSVTCDIGLKLYVDQLTKAMNSPEVMNKYKPQIEADFIKGALIMFYKNRDKEQLANAAWQRLQNGEAFDKVAREASEDNASSYKGGQVGLVRANYLGSKVGDVWRKIEPDSYSKPIERYGNYYILTRTKLTDDDISSILKKEAYNLASDQVSQELAVFEKATVIKRGADLDLPSSNPEASR